MSWVRVGEIEDGPSVVEIEGVRILFGSSDASSWAIEDRCSHADCAFSADGEIDGPTVVCDCHGSEFDLFTGEVRRGPADAPVRVFESRVNGGVLEVRL